MSDVNIRHSSRFALATIVSLLLVVVVTAAVIGSGRGTATFAAGTPESTAQAYLQAVADNRRSDALEFLTEDARRNCQTDSAGPFFTQRLSRVTLLHTDLNGDRADVQVAITQSFGGGLFDTDGSTVRSTLTLERTSDGWRISAGLWPFACIKRVAP